MKHITPRHMIGFNDELRKEAGRFGDAFRTAGRFIRSGYGKGAGMLSREFKGAYGKQMMLGAGVGAASGAALADPDQPGSRFRGALGGAAVGGGLAGGRILATGRGRQAAGKGLKDFYHRQRYALTGKGIGKTDKAKLERARDIGLVEKFDKKKFSPDQFGGDAQKARNAANKAKEAIKIQEDALVKGYMSAPGTVHGMLTRPIDTLKSGWQRGGAPGKIFTGLGAYETGKGLIEKPEEGGPGRLEKGLRGAGSAVGWMVAPTTVVGGQIVGMGGGSIGGRVGKLGDRVVQRVRRPGQVAPQGGY